MTTKESEINIANPQDESVFQDVIDNDTVADKVTKAFDNYAKYKIETGNLIDSCDFLRTPKGGAWRDLFDSSDSSDEEKSNYVPIAKKRDSVENLKKLPSTDDMDKFQNLIESQKTSASKTI